ncbi:MAG: ABC transporter substrate-binding protein [Campylobacterales bacterium]|nr:ABC transporter substrate-binding protein [Campylobacterales bacterium]
MRLFALLFLLMSLSLHAQKQVTLQLLWKHQFEFAGYYMAQEKGFYRDAGLDVRFKEYSFGLDIPGSVLRGESDFGLDGSGLILEAMQGKPLYLITTTFQTSPFVLLTKKRDDLLHVSDLKGKKVMVTPNQVAMASLSAMLRTNNIGESDYEAQVHSFDIEDLIDGTTDAMSAYLSNEPFHMIERNLSYTIFNPSDHGFDFYDNILFTSRSLAARDPELIDAFYAASRKGWLYAFDHIEESALVIQKHYNTQNKSLEHLIYEGETIKSLSGYGTPNFGSFKPAIISQIAQTYKLLDITKATLDTDGLIYPPSIMQEQIVDYALIWKILAAVALVLAGFGVWNRKLRQLNTQIAQAKRQVQLLLDYAGQGFLSFGRDCRIHDTYSKACQSYLGDTIASAKINLLLFESEAKQALFEQTVAAALDASEELSQKALLSLLPSFVLHRKRALKLEYRIIDTQTIMMILTNVSAEKRLEKKVAQEQERLKMIVAVVSESDTFFEAKAELHKRYGSSACMIDPHKTPLYNLSEAYRAIHTLKGTFAQLYMYRSVEALHEIESQLSQMLRSAHSDNETLKSLLCASEPLEALEDDLQILRSVLSDTFVDGERFVKIEAAQINTLHEKVTQLFNAHAQADPKCASLVSFVETLTRPKLSVLLHPYIALCTDLAAKLHKELYPLQLHGDAQLSVPDHFRPWVKSLIHLFRNSLDHGIELPEERLSKNKEEKGALICTFKQEKDMLHLTIADDGAGIDKDRLIARLRERGIDTDALDDEVLYRHIFDAELSTKEEVSTLSGRGMGLSAFYQELERLGGAVRITTCKDAGTTFELTIPLKESL